MLMRKIFTSLLCMLASGALPLYAADITVDGLTYTISGSNLKVKKGPVAGDVVIPETVTDGGKTYTVTEISNNAFKGAAITSVVMPNTCTAIGSYAFQDCASLTSVTVGNALKKVGSSSFKGCIQLPSISLPATVTSLGISCFDGCRLFTSFVIPDGVGMATGSPLANCPNLRSITLGKKTMTFTCSATCPQSPIEEILVVEGNTYKFTSVDGVLYKSGNSLEEYPVAKPAAAFTIPETVTKLNATFNGCTVLKSVVFNNKITSIRSNSFQNCKELESIILGNVLSSIGLNVFKDSPKFREIIVPADNPYYSFSDGALFNKTATTLHMRFGSVPGTSFTVPATVDTIGTGAFANNVLLETVRMGDKVKLIGGLAFNNCSALKSINIPQSVVEIGEGAFTKCKKLTSIQLPDSLEILGSEAFYYCSSLTKCNLPEKLTIIGENTYYNTALAEAIVPDKVVEIGAGAFYTSGTLEKVVIGAGVKKIGAEAFIDYYEESKPSVTFKPTTPPELGNNAFNTGLMIFVPAESIEAYKAAEAYKGYDIQPSVASKAYDVTLTAAGTLSEVIPASQLNGVVTLTITGDMNGNDFEYINQMPLLTEVNLEKARVVDGGKNIVTQSAVIPKKAFTKNIKLKSIVVPSTVTELADSALCSHVAFSNTDVLESVELPEGLSRIGAYAFFARGSLTKVRLPETLKKLGKGAFQECSGLPSIEVPALIDTISEDAFLSCGSLESVKFNEGLRVVDERAFQSCKKLNNLVIPNSVDSIGSQAFSMCDSLTNVKLPANLRYMMNYAFAWNKKLKTIDLPETLEYIGMSCFAGCDALTRVSLPENLKYLKQSAFSMCTALERIDIPQGIQEVGASVCYSCKSLKTASLCYNLPLPGETYPPTDEVEGMKEKLNYRSGVFQNCISLEAVYIGPNCFFLAEDMFRNTPKLKTIYVNCMTPPDMIDGENAFTAFNAVLYVPASSINAYKTSRHWKNFTDIRAIDGSSGITDMFEDAVAVEVKVSEGEISFADPDADVTVCNLSGQVVYAGKAVRLSVAKGLYVLSLNGKPYKVLVP